MRLPLLPFLMVLQISNANLFVQPVWLNLDDRWPKHTSDPFAAKEHSLFEYKFAPGHGHFHYVDAPASV